MTKAGRFYYSVIFCTEDKILTGPSNALCNVANSYKIHPRAQISDFLPYTRPSHISGDI